MEKLKEWIGNAVKWVRPDGLQHIIVSALIMVALGWIRPLIIGVLITASVGLFKEIYDGLTGKGTMESHDIWCDCIGILLGLFLVFLNSLG